MSEWKEYKLGDIADFNMGQSPESKFYNFKGIGLPFLQGNRTFGHKFPTFDTFCTDPKKIAYKGEILFSVRAPVGDINIVNTKICIGRGLCSISSKNGNNLFLYYLLNFLKKGIINSESGTVFGSVNKDDLNNISVNIPVSINEQNVIASILSSLDDKIDLLHRQNKTLDQLAETLFRQWFVEEADESWENGRLKDILESIESGSRPKGGIDPELKEGIPSIGAENINGLGVYDFSKTKFITYEFFKSMKRGIIKNYDVLIYKDGAYVGRKGMFADKFPYDICTVNEHVFILRANNRANQFFLYFLLQQDELAQLNSNSAQPGLNQGAMNSFEIVIPPLELLNQFEEKAKSLIDKIFFNCNQIRTLTQLRDTLLPKLMRGEVRVIN